MMQSCRPCCDLVATLRARTHARSTCGSEDVSTLEGRAPTNLYRNPHPTPRPPQANVLCVWYKSVNCRGGGGPGLARVVRPELSRGREEATSNCPGRG
jgi:hypothetical protein